MNLCSRKTTFGLPRCSFGLRRHVGYQDSFVPKNRGCRGVAVAPRAALEDVVTMKDERLQTEVSHAPEITPAQLDSQRFKEHWSVQFWRDFSSKEFLKDIMDNNSPVSARLNAFVDTLSKALTTSDVLRSTEAVQYWAYHSLRSGFFSAQAIMGLAAARVAANRDASSTAVMTRMEEIARSGWQGPLAEAFMAYYQDYECIKQGAYALPYDMTSTSHRQFNPLYVIRKANAFFTEASDTLKRREQGKAEEVWLKSFNLPAYFQNTFHYQSDGWMSSKSAAVYESSTETLFVGRQDAMQRSTLLNLSEFMKGKDPSQLSALEVACGTGRFATFLKDNYPTLDLTLTDLSPFYLAQARENVSYWKKLRAPSLSLSGVDGNGTTFVQTPAESLDVASESMDIVYSVYLFHELPEDVREKAAAEMARVVKPGGIVVLTDSVQVGDRPSMDATLGNFGSFNEPYYVNYIQSDLGSLFEKAGLVCEQKVVSSTTKSLSFRKPAPGEGVEVNTEDAVKITQAPDVVDTEIDVANN